MTSASKRNKPKRVSKRKGQTLRGRMAGIRREMGNLGAGNGGAGLFGAALQQLEAMGDEIADATDRMMTACEDIRDAAEAITAKTKGRATKAKLKRISEKTGDIFEACSFQDLTGQRIGKIKRTVTVIENALDAVSALAGGQGTDKGANKGTGMSKGKSKVKGIDRIDGGITLEGPQINGPAVSQADIDSLFD